MTIQQVLSLLLLCMWLPHPCHTEMLFRRTPDLRPKSFGGRASGNDGKTIHRQKRGWMWNQFFLLEEYTGSDYQYVGKVGFSVTLLYNYQVSFYRVLVSMFHSIRNMHYVRNRFAGTICMFCPARITKLTLVLKVIQKYLNETTEDIVENFVCFTTSFLPAANSVSLLHQNIMFYISL